jgi:predicted Zn-dependent peptidase
MVHQYARSSQRDRSQKSKGRSHQRISDSIEKTVFSNGLTLITECMPQAKGVAAGFWIRAGTRHESLKDHGASHFLEHLLFKGTRSRSALQLAQMIDRVGGDFNAFTTRENTCFHILMLRRDLPLALDILSDVFKYSELSTDEVEREREVILQEMTMVEENPEEMAFDVFLDQVYEGSPLGRPILGSRQSIKKMTRDQLFRFYDQHYQPKNLVVSVAGNVRHEAIIHLLGDLVERDRIIRRGKSSGGRQNPGGKSQADTLSTESHFSGKLSSKAYWADYPSEQSHLIWGVRGPSFSDSTRLSAVLVNERLGGGMSSLLFQEIREKKGLAYSVYSSLQPYSDTGILSVYAATDPSKVELCLTLIERSVRRLLEDGINKKSLGDLKEHLRGSILLSADDVEGRMMSLAKSEIYLGYPFSADQVVSRITRLTLSQVRESLHSLFAPGQARSLLILGNRPKFSPSGGSRWQKIKMP